MEQEQFYFNTNKQLWNNKVPVHLASGFYNVPAFLEGQTSLNSIELEELGPVAGKSLLHLQCHFGMDTLSWARLGAKATGLDFSEAAIREARQLAHKTGQTADFVCANVYDAPGYVKGPFDIIFTSYGTIGWLPDLQRWAKVIRQLLKPGGCFYMADFHPMVWLFDNAFTHIKYSYFNNGQPIEEQNEGTYADPTASLNDKEFGWNHSLSDLLNALLQQGLQLSFFNEHNYSPYNCFANMVAVSPGRWQIKGLENKIPMLYSLKVVAPAS
ncbi:MAG: class I SAM-dependent methyltransferase [Candidatus Pseudobacter hemicellulosilyticus]|uniref:Class I SAM-dependent methyltransferase n=1 Tax=Candidatus Pseudobacter hemicellulosilyticus TaxID=3121375 RepID=A0AAJ6BJK7_9BACT|nr:MAG: class I SAM-dependent methyltransferase [Pseudobacter sp.]